MSLPANFMKNFGLYKGKSGQGLFLVCFQIST